MLAVVEKALMLLDAFVENIQQPYLVEAPYKNIPFYKQVREEVLWH